MVKRGYVNLLFLLDVFTRLCELGGTASQRRQWRDFFFDCYFLSRLLSKLHFNGDGSFSFQIDKAVHRHCERLRPNESSDEILSEILGLCKIVYLIVE